MTMVAPFETSFARALLSADQPIPHGVTAHNAAVPTRRFAVYRDNVVTSLAAALRSRFPVVEKIVGEEFFAAMARTFVLERPPRTPWLAMYGDDFAGFIAAFEPARELAYLADVARLEAARTRAYHAADVAPADASEFAALDANAIAGLRVDLHPSLEIVRSSHPIVTIWAMNSGEQTLAPIENWRGEDALVVRPHLDVEVRSLPAGGAAFLLALAEKRPLGEAAEVALADHPQFDLSCNLAGLIGWGLVRSGIPPATRGQGLL
jgi:Putative DNA-binding domain